MLKEARERSRIAAEWWEQTYKVGRDDVAFSVQGAQWDARVLQMRKDDKRPSLTANKLRKHHKQVVNDVRYRRPVIHCSPASHVAAGESFTTEKEMVYNQAEIAEGIIRHEEAVCGAEAHYDRAFQHAVEAGVGWLRVLCDYDDESFYQHIRVKSVRNRWSVLLDPFVDTPDFRDADWGFVFTRLRRDEFLRRYKGAMIGELPGNSDAHRLWITDSTVGVAEYFTREAYDRTLLRLTDGRIEWEDEIKDQLSKLREAGIDVHKSRKQTCHRVWWRKITAWSQLTKPVQWPGSTIPLVPVFGDSIDLDSVTLYRGLTHDAHDDQRMLNYLYSAATERIGNSPKSPYIATVEQTRNRPEWDNLNLKNYPVLRYNADPMAPPPQRQDGATMPVAELTMAANMEQSIASTLGRYEASVGAPSNETSGRAITARAAESDQGSFNFVDNLSKAMQRIGEIFVELIPKVYDDEERMVEIINDEGISDTVRINKVEQDQNFGGRTIKHDMTKGRISIEVRAMKTSDSMRREVVEALTEVARSVPSVGQLVIDVIAANMPWQGAKQLSERLKRALPPNVLSEEERKDMGIDLSQPNPQQQLEQAKIQSEQAKAQADIAKAEADKAQAAAKLAEVQAMASGLQGELPALVRRIVAQSLAELIRGQQQGDSQNRSA